LKFVSVVLLFFVLIFAYMMAADSSEAAVKGKRDFATWYGPGFYGNRTACGQTYSLHIRGTAVPSSGSRSMQCGTRVTVCRFSNCVRIRVIDTGGFRDHQFDLSARTAMDLCRCVKPYTMGVVWRHGWLY
jgi:rare lipoprotein A (peptidoglycan hydrolase)